MKNYLLLAAICILFAALATSCEKDEPEQTIAIALDRDKMQLEEGQSRQLTATTDPAGAEVIWSSSAPSVVTVDQTGLVKTIKEGEAVIAAASKNNRAICYVTVGKTDPSLKLKLAVPSGAEAKLPLAGKVDCIVDWGDGSPLQTVTEAYPTHTYAAGVYTVSILGTVTELSTYKVYDILNDPQRGYITAVVNWGNTGLTKMSNAFFGCHNLETLAGDASGVLDKVSNFNYAFAGCTKLVSIPEDLFSYCSEVTAFIYTFFECHSLASIPKGLFAHCPLANNFCFTFADCHSLVSIPEDLFSRCPEATTFYGTFNNCISLASVPAGLFSRCPEVTDFRGLFADCSSLTTVPTGIFDRCTKVTDFCYCFRNCVKLAGESPYTVINGQKVHLYERNSANGFALMTYYDSCFRKCTGLSDYDGIPDKWK